ncbi:DUF1203 domain-containing protein [Yinghuangia soli]|uniref:DUF1203 domain-containing protein n=1 Tax=Yinghuangia soli TaxID=2908204 RepID=A0AA41U1J2_9ACTN|nr:DUF1203 domain-containing protein [Yinghuangia soli]MCF2529605.1 DUF1203 domain-containing protein [Yinghuangia soli]
MTDNPNDSFLFHALPADLLAAIRAGGPDASGNPADRARHWEAGRPLRCCLRYSEAGDELLLFGVAAPMPGTSPYREIGAVLVHADECPGPVRTDGYPEEWYGRPQILRAYDARGWIHGATRMHDGSDPERELAEMFAHPEVVQVHSRNISWGCYMFAVTRSGSPAETVWTPAV